MKRSFALLTTLVVLAGATNVASAGDLVAHWHSFWHSVDRDFHRNNCWPEPFVHADRAAVMKPFGVMVHNGWRAQNLMGDHHFRPGSNELSHAGRSKLLVTLTQAPQQYRTVYVQRKLDKEETSARVDAVQQYAALILPDGELPAVELTDVQPRGWSADEINTVHSQFRTTFPPPRLPAPVQESE